MVRLTMFAVAGAVVFLSSITAAAQLTPAGQETRILPVSDIRGIDVARQGQTLNILVRLSAQPSAASVSTIGDDLRIDIDGLMLATLRLTPPDQSPLRSVSADGSAITLRGAALEDADVIIYRNALLVSGTLAPADVMSTSGDSTDSLAPSVPAKTQESSLSGQNAGGMNVRPPASPDPSDISPTRCAAAEAELAIDSWSLDAMGDHALCLIRQERFAEARARIDQLEAITPSDSRIQIGRSALAAHTDLSRPVGALMPASGQRPDQAPPDMTGSDFSEGAKEAASGPDNDLQLPLPR